MTKPLFSVIIPVRVENDYLKETLAYLGKQTFKSFEVIVITDKVSGDANPAQKRNLGVSKAKGKYLAFLDDDSYPHPDWLKNAKTHLESDSSLAAVCGPCLTPPHDHPRQHASGLVLGSLLGSGGAGIYRNLPQPQRFVDDYPSVNLIVTKKDFDRVKGYDTHHWPGEDTILCLNLTKNLGKKILYHPSIVVYHHRRSVLIPHLKQISRYALHRGHFARIFPATSLRIGYLLPSIFFLYLVSLAALIASGYSASIFPDSMIHLSLLPLYLYISILILTFSGFLYHTRSLPLSLLAAVTIPATHLYYGYLFIIGFFSPRLGFTAHKVDAQSGKYVGG